MRKVSYSPLFRCLVCLILVCCILVNLSPITAEALDPMTWVWLEASMVFASIMSGLGVSPVDELAAGFRETCDDCWDFISLNYDFVTDDEKIAVWSTGTDELPFMIDQELIEAVRDWLFSSETVVEQVSEVGFLYYDVYCLPEFTEAMTSYAESGFTTHFLAFSPSTYYLFMVDQEPVVTDSGGYKFTSPVTLHSFKWARSYVNGWIYNGADSHSSGYFTKPGPFLWCNLFDGPPSSTYAVSSDEESFSLGYIAPSSEDFTTGYSSWSAGAISVPGIRSKEEEREVVVPLSIPGTAADVYSFAQTDVWTGANTAADVIAQAVPITGTDTPIPDSPDTPDVPENLQAYTFDLRDFFPFCIPFDLYDFFSVLHAPPEAPKFHWDIQDTSGRTYSIDVDLSSWDNVASFFRKLQLFLFITGLAAASRKYIKW